MQEQAAARETNEPRRSLVALTTVRKGETSEKILDSPMSHHAKDRKVVFPNQTAPLMP